MVNLQQLFIVFEVFGPGTLRVGVQWLYSREGGKGVGGGEKWSVKTVHCRASVCMCVRVSMCVCVCACVCVSPRLLTARWKLLTS